MFGLQETAEAHEARLDFDGIYDLRALLKAVRKGRTLYPVHLHGVASTLEARTCAFPADATPLAPASCGQHAWDEMTPT